MAALAKILYSQLFKSLPYPQTQQTGHTVIVTGSNVGLGKEAARHFARLGASKVILAVRNTAAGEAAKLDIETDPKVVSGVVEVWPLDLASYASVKAFAARATKDLDRIDVLLENAAIATNAFKLFEQDESTLTVNVVSTFLLGLLLLPKLKDTAAKYETRPNLTVVSSDMHAFTKLPEHKKAAKGKLFATLSDKNLAVMGERYAVSKLLEVFAIRSIAAQGGEDYPVIINTVNPGLCHSELAREAGWGLAVFKFFFARSTEVGSRTLVHAATGGASTHGAYLSDCEITQPAAFVRSDEGKALQKTVWDELTTKLESIEPGVTKNL